MQLQWLAKYRKIEQSVLKTPLYLQDLNAIENVISFYMQVARDKRNKDKAMHKVGKSLGTLSQFRTIWK